MDSDLIDGGADDDRFFAADGEADEIFGGTGDDQAAVDELLDTFSEVETIL